MVMTARGSTELLETLQLGLGLGEVGRKGVRVLYTADASIYIDISRTFRAMQCLDLLIRQVESARETCLEWPPLNPAEGAKPSS